MKHVGLRFFFVQEVTKRGEHNADDERQRCALAVPSNDGSGTVTIWFVFTTVGTLWTMSTSARP